jgi:hypothetical protein
MRGRNIAAATVVAALGLGGAACGASSSGGSAARSAPPSASHTNNVLKTWSTHCTLLNGYGYQIQLSATNQSSTPQYTPGWTVVLYANDAAPNTVTIVGNTNNLNDGLVLPHKLVEPGQTVTSHVWEVFGSTPANSCGIA